LKKYRSLLVFVLYFCELLLYLTINNYIDSQVNTYFVISLVSEYIEIANIFRDFLLVILVSNIYREDKVLLLLNCKFKNFNGIILLMANSISRALTKMDLVWSGALFFSFTEFFPIYGL
jgi:hypothetical protein